MSIKLKRVRLGLAFVLAVFVGVFVALFVVPIGYDLVRGVRKWSEEVQLDDGRIITIDRSVQFSSSTSIGGSAYSVVETRATLSFRSALAELAPWDVNLLPLVLYRDGGTAEWVIVASTINCDTWEKRHRHLPPYWEFRLRGSEWIEKDVSPVSMDRAANLLLPVYERESPPRHVTLAEKAALNMYRHEPFGVVKAKTRWNCM